LGKVWEVGGYGCQNDGPDEAGTIGGGGREGGRERGEEGGKEGGRAQTQKEAGREGGRVGEQVLTGKVC